MSIHYEIRSAAPTFRLRPFTSKESVASDFIVDHGDLGLKWDKICNVVIFGDSFYRFNRANIIHSVFNGTYYFTYHGMGDLDSVFTMKNGKKHGKYTAYAPSKNPYIMHEKKLLAPKFSLGPFQKEEEYDDDFKPIIATGSYNLNRKEGKWYMFYINENIKEECFYQLDQLHGYKAIYEEDNTKSYDGFYNNGRPVGEHDTYIDGELVTREIRYGATKYRRYTYRSGKNVSVIDYKIINATKEVEYLDKTKGKVSYKHVPYKKHVKEGKFVLYYSNSKKKLEGQYVSDCLHGTIISYHINGLMHTTCTYLNNNRNGLFREMMFMADGKTEKIKIEGRYTNGRRTGQWKFHGDKVYVEDY